MQTALDQMLLRTSYVEEKIKELDSVHSKAFATTELLTSQICSALQKTAVGFKRPRSAPPQERSSKERRRKQRCEASTLTTHGEEVLSFVASPIFSYSLSLSLSLSLSPCSSLRKAEIANQASQSSLIQC